MSAEPSSGLKLLRCIGHCQWLPLGVRDRIIRRFVSPGTSPLAFEADFFGLLYPGSLASYIDWSVYFFGCYEPRLIELITGLGVVLAPRTVLDIGANAGHHTLVLSRHAQAVHAFEPYELVRGQLQAKVARNALGHVTVHPFAVGGRRERLQFYAPTSGNLGTGSLLVGHARENNTRVTEIEVIGGDDYVREQGIRDIDLIKIDVEGYEHEVLLGIRATIAAQRPVVIMEFSDESKERFGSAEKFLGLWPEHYLAYFVDETGRHYRLRDLDFAADEGNVLMMPEETHPRLKGLRFSDAAAKGVTV